MKRQFLSILLAVCMILSIVPPPASAAESPATRASLAQFLVDGLGLESLYDEDTPVSFPDLPESHPNYRAAAILANTAGFIYSNGSFQPDGQVNRAEAATLLYRLGKLGGAPADTPIPTDVANHWTYDYIMPVLACGAMRTYSDGTFQPDSPVYLSEIYLDALNAAALSDGIYTLTPKCAEETCLEVAGGSAEDGANVQIFTSNGSPAQLWKFTYLGDGYYTLTSQASQKALEVEFGTALSETNVQQFDSNSTPAQQWMLKDAGDGYWYVISRLKPDADTEPYTELYLDVAGGANASETNVQVFLPTHSDAQKWKITAVDVALDGAYTLTPKCADDMRLEVAGGSTENGANVQTFTANGTPAQLWNFTYLGDGYYTITSLVSGKTMELTGGASVERTNVQQFEPNGTPAQQWKLEDAGDGFWHIIPRLNGELHLDVENGSDTAGTNVQVFLPTDSQGQLWKIEKASARTVTVTLDPQGGFLSHPCVLYMAGISIGSLPVPFRSGYTFIGWTRQPQNESQIVSPGSLSVTEDITLYAQWEAAAASTNPLPFYVSGIALHSDSGSQQMVNGIPQGMLTVEVHMKQVAAGAAGTLCLVAYSQDGQLLSIQQKQGAANDGTFSVDNRNGKIADLKAFVLSGSGTPLANAYSYKEHSAGSSAIQPLARSRTLTPVASVDGVEPYGTYWYPTNGSNIISADLSQSPALAYSLTISDQTEFTSGKPEGYDPAALLEWGKDPGLNIDILHKYGFTGKGAVVAYVDQPIANHEQYSQTNLHYVNNTDSTESMHGPAVLSLLAGKDIGTAPEAEVYYYAHASWKADQITHAACLYQIIEQNKSLPAGKKITMVGFSDNIDEREKNADAFRDAVAACEEAGIMVWFCEEYGGATFLPMSDKNDPANVVAESWWGTEHQPKLVMVPAAGRTTAATLGGTSYIYWANGGLSWTMPYMLGLYASAVKIDPSLTQEQLRQLVVSTAYDNNGLPVVNPVGFIAAVLDRAGRGAEASALRREATARTQYLYAVMDTSRMSREDVSAAGSYLSAITDATILTVDADAFDSAQALYEALRADAANRGGTVVGVQIFGTPDMIPSFQVDYKVLMGTGEVDAGGAFLTDLFYGNFNNAPVQLSNGYNVMDHFEQGRNIDLVPQWPVARLPLSKGEFSAFFSKYRQFVLDTGLSQQDLVNFSSPIFASANHIDDMGIFLNRMQSEFHLLNVPCRLYGNQDGQYPVTTSILGNFTADNLALENDRGIMELLINGHGQWNNIDQCIYTADNREQRVSFINMNTICSVLDGNAYYLDCWTCSNGYGMANNLTTAALNGQCVGAFTATAAIANNGVNCNASLAEMKRSNFYYFYYAYLKALSEGQTRSQSFFTAQRAYGEALIADSANGICGEANYQFNLYNLLAYHNFGVLEPSAAWAVFDGTSDIGKDADVSSNGFLTSGLPQGSPIRVNYTDRSELQTGTASAESCTAQQLDNGYIRYTLRYSAPVGMGVCVFNPPSGSRFKLLDTSGTVGGEGVLQFDLLPQALIGDEIVVNFFRNDEDRYLVFLTPTIPIWQSSGSESGDAWTPGFSTAGSIAEDTYAVHSLTARELDNGCVRFRLEYTAPEGLYTSIFSPPHGDRFMQLSTGTASGERSTLVFDLPKEEVAANFTIKFYYGDTYFCVYVTP